MTTKKTVKDILKNHSDNTVYVPFLQEDRQTLTVRRRHIWADTKRALSRPSFNDKIGLNFVFVGEPALDAGGPLREYFRLLWLSLHQNLHLFNGKENVRVLAYNITAIQQQEYVIIGHCISLALVYGGSAPHFFSESLVSQLFNEPLTEEAIDDIPNEETSKLIKKVCRIIGFLLLFFCPFLMLSYYLRVLFSFFM